MSPARGVNERVAGACSMDETRWQVLVSTTADSIMTVDPDHRILTINQVVPGLTRDRVIGQPLTSFVPAERRALVTNVVSQVFADGEPVRYTALGTGPHPGDRFYEVLITPVRRGASVCEAIFVARDITDLVRFQRSVMEARRLISSQNAALVQAHTQRRRMSAMMVHDFAGPLSTVLANAHHLQAQLSTPETQEALHDLIGAAERMLRMTENLLDVDRSIDGKLTPHLTPLALRSLLESCVRDTQRRVRLSGHRVAAEIAPDIGDVLADEALLRRAVDNLLDNAAKYAPGGSTIVVGATVQDDVVRVRIGDAGPGVPDEFKERIFDPYVRLESEADLHARPGHGLGLTLCRLAIKSHGGRVWVEDAVPVGAVFCIELPRLAAR